MLYIKIFFVRKHNFPVYYLLTNRYSAEEAVESGTFIRAIGLNRRQFVFRVVQDLDPE